MVVSVLIPTYRRLEFLKRAVADVRLQTYKDWELVVSDDEIGDNETWRWLTQEALRDSRIKIVKNMQDRHGQVFNVNNGLRVCRGEWIKLLFDDDRMLPNCLEEMVGVTHRIEPYEVATGGEVVMIGCRAQKWRNGQFVGDEVDFTIGSTQSNRDATINIVDQSDCRRAICMYDRWNGRTPTHMLIRRSAIESGALMPEDGRYYVPVDIVWFARILAHGSYAMTDRVLVGQCEGEVESITSGAKSNEFALDAELKKAYSDIFESMPIEERQSLSVGDVISEINGIRGIYHIKCCHWLGGIKMILKSIGINRGALLVLRWLLQESFPKHFSATKRIVIC